jgi:hypothetical protein
MNYILSVVLEILKFLKEKGYVAEILAWAEEQAANTESSIDDVAVKFIKLIIG